MQKIIWMCLFIVFGFFNGLSAAENDVLSDEDAQIRNYISALIEQRRNDTPPAWFTDREKDIFTGVSSGARHAPNELSEFHRLSQWNAQDILSRRKVAEIFHSISNLFIAEAFSIQGICFRLNASDVFSPREYFLAPKCLAITALGTIYFLKELYSSPRQPRLPFANDMIVPSERLYSPAGTHTQPRPSFLSTIIIGPPALFLGTTFPALFVDQYELGSKILTVAVVSAVLMTGLIIYIILRPSRIFDSSSV